MSKPTIYVSRTNILHPTIFRESLLATRKMFSDYSLEWHYQTDTYVPSKLDYATMMIIVVDSSDTMTVGRGVYGEYTRAIHNNIPVYCLYKRLSDKVWQLYELSLNRIGTSSSSYAKVQLQKNVTNQVINLFSIVIPTKEGVLVGDEKPRRYSLLTKK